MTPAAVALVLAALTSSVCESPPLHISVDLGDEADDAAMAGYLRERVGPPRRCAWTVDGPHLRAAVHWADPDRGRYALELSAVSADGRRSSAPIRHECDCSSPEIGEFFAAHTAEAIADLPPAPPVAVAVAPPPRPPPPSAMPRRGPSPPPTSRSTSGRSWPAGIALTAIGGAGLVVGSTLWGVGNSGYRPDPRLRRNLMPAGIAVTTTAIVTTLAGAAILMLATRVQRGHLAHVPPRRRRTGDTATTRARS